MDTLVLVAHGAFHNLGGLCEHQPLSRELYLYVLVSKQVAGPPHILSAKTISKVL